MQKEMAVNSSLSLSVLYASSVPKLSSKIPLQSREARVFNLINLKTLAPCPTRFKLYGNSAKTRNPTKLNAAGLYEYEPDLNEDPVDRWATNTIDPVRFLTFFQPPLFLFVCVCDFFSFLFWFIGGFCVWDI